MNIELQKQLELPGFTANETAQCLHLSAAEYQDREDGRVDMNLPERCELPRCTSENMQPPATAAADPIHEKNRNAGDRLREILVMRAYIARNRLWANVVEMAKQVSLFLGTYLTEAQGGFLAKGKYIIFFSPQFEDYVNLVNNHRNKTILQTILSDLGCGDSCNIEFMILPPVSAAEKA